MRAKMLDAVPFHRQLARWERAGVDLPKQTVNDALNAWGDIFTPLANAIAAQVLAAPVVHADASWQRLQAKRACARLHLWTTLGGGQVAYRLTTDQTHARAAELIPSSFTGRLVTDAWPGWFTVNLGERLAFCNAHARRPFADWAKRNPQNPHARRIVELYRDVGRLEHEADAGPDDQLLERRRRIRDQRSRPIMERIKTTAAEIATAYPPSHQLAD